MTLWIRLGSFFLSFGRVSPDRNGPAGVRVYHAGNRIEKRNGREVVREDKQFHHISCPCFQCEFQQRPKYRTQPYETALGVFKEKL